MPRFSNGLQGLSAMLEDPEAAAFVDDVASYYAGKTEAILHRYGPGPLVHYHNGLIDGPPAPGLTVEQLRRALHESQERLLWHAARSWLADQMLSGRIVDVGCGLGGGSIFWSREFGAEVLAVSNVTGHLELVRRFATEAGVGDRVQPLLSDARSIPGYSEFDAAVALDSFCHIPRISLFRRIQELLRPGRPLFISDYFSNHHRFKAAFDAHWHAQLGTVDEYVRLAKDAGFVTEEVEDLSEDAHHFWTTTLALMDAEARADPNLAETRKQSRRAHVTVCEGFEAGGMRYALLSLRKA